MKRQLVLTILLALVVVAPASAVTILQCSTNSGIWTNGGCAQQSVFATMQSSLDWGAPTAGGWGAHPLEKGLGTAQGNTFNTSVSQWGATGSDGTSIGVGAGPGVGASHAVMQRVDNAELVFDPGFGSGGWDFIASTSNPYYLGWASFSGHANSAPLTAAGFPVCPAVNCTNNTTDQFYTGPDFYDHGTPGQIGGSSTAVPYVGDHLVGFNQTDLQDQSMTLSFTKAGAGVDALAFSVVAMSNTQINGQTTAQANWLGGATPSGILHILVQAYDNVNPLLGTLLYSYEIEVNASFGQCSGLSNTTQPVPCNDAPVVLIQGTQGLFNIRSVVISSTTDASGFLIDELYYNQTSDGGGGIVPEPSEFFLIGSGLLLVGVIAKRRGIVRL